MIQGRVQGVYFRESMRIKAETHGVAGWVRNCNDGTVVAVVHGDASAVDEIVKWAHRGPDLAEVEQVKVLQHEGSYTTFEVIR